MYNFPFGKISKERRPIMKNFFVCWLLIGVISYPLVAQDIIYSSSKDLFAQRGDTVATLKFEKRTKNQIVLTGGADYRITAGEDESMCRLLKKCCFAVRCSNGNLYLNCCKLRYKKITIWCLVCSSSSTGRKSLFLCDAARFSCRRDFCR